MNTKASDSNSREQDGLGDATLAAEIVRELHDDDR